MAGFEVIIEAMVRPVNYCAFFATEAEAIAHCREMNRGLSSKDTRVCAVVHGPGCIHDDNHPEGCPCSDWAVVDLDTAKDLLGYGEPGGPTCLIVTD